MPFRLEIHRQAGKTLAALPEQLRSRIWERLNALKETPRPHGCTKLTGFKPHLWRIGIGDYRAIYQVLEAEELIGIVEITLRSEDTYKQ
jgi:mRNA interferase RelE/StbE